jgi:hypothetical protein
VPPCLLPAQLSSQRFCEPKGSFFFLSLSLSLSLPLSLSFVCISFLLNQKWSAPETKESSCALSVFDIFRKSKGGRWPSNEWPENETLTPLRDPEIWNQGLISSALAEGQTKGLRSSWCSHTGSLAPHMAPAGHWCPILSSHSLRLDKREPVMDSVAVRDAFSFSHVCRSCWK